MGNSEVSMKEGAMVELKKVGCAGWWFVKVLGKHFYELFIASLYFLQAQESTLLLASCLI